MRVASQHRPRAGRRKPPSGPRLDAGVGVAELAAVAGRLLEVVAEHLVELDQVLPVRLEPIGEAIMELCARLLRQGVVGGVADQQVPEPEGVVARQGGRRRVDQLLAHEPDERRLDVGGMGQLDDGAAMEDSALDRAAVDHRPLLSGEAVEPGLQERLHGGRHAHVAMLANERDTSSTNSGLPSAIAIRTNQRPAATTNRQAQSPW